MTPRLIKKPRGQLYHPGGIIFYFISLIVISNIKVFPANSWFVSIYILSLVTLYTFTAWPYGVYNVCHSSYCPGFSKSDLLISTTSDSSLSP
jgi:hypothetical protein